MVASPNRSTGDVRVRISKSGQVTLPASIREKLGVGLGDFVTFSEQPDGAIEVHPARILSVEEISGKFGRPIDERDLQKALREARQIGAVRRKYRDGSIVDDLD